MEAAAAMLSSSSLAALWVCQSDVSDEKCCPHSSKMRKTKLQARVLVCSVSVLSRDR